MKATEVFVEQVIIGAVALLVAGLPFAPELIRSWPGDGGNSVAQAIVLVLVVGAAYLLGIVLDRFIDTLLQRLDRQNRLRFAISKFTSVPPDWKDPFPEGEYRMAALQMGGAVAEWLNYLRSRIRLSRALAALLPGLTVSGVVAAARLGLSPISIEVPLLEGFYTAVAVGVTYLLAFLLAVGLDNGPRAAPRTDAEGKDIIKFGKPRGYFKKDAEGRGAHGRKLILDLAADPAIWGAAALVAGSFVLAWCLGFECRPLWAIPILGTLLAAVSGWSWWRISQTYWQFLRRAFRAHEKAAAAKASR